MATKYTPQTQQTITSEWLGMRSSAQRVGLSPGRMYELVRAGEIPGVLTEIGWLFSPAVLDEYAALRVKWARKGGRHIVEPARQAVKEWATPSRKRKRPC